jgi:hypothetical protein
MLILVNHVIGHSSFRVLFHIAKTIIFPKHYVRRNPGSYTYRRILPGKKCIADIQRNVEYPAISIYRFWIIFVPDILSGAIVAESGFV